MKYVFANISAFIKKETSIFIVTVICVLTSAILLNFSYGLYYNSQMEKKEINAEKNPIACFINKDAAPSHQQIKEFVEALPEEISKNMEFYFSGTVKSYTDAILFDQLESRFVYRDGMYSSLPEFHENITNSLVSGRAISETEENNGEQVAVIYYNRAESDPLIIEYNNDKMFISFLGIRYWVIGEHNMGMGGLPVVPFLSVPDDFLYDGTMILTPKSVITRSQYQTMIHTAEMTIPNAITFPNLKLPDSDSVTISNNMIIASLLIAVLCSLNFTMLYQYIMDKRRKTLAVFRLAGCSKRKAALLYMTECLCISVPCYCAGFGIFKLLLHSVFSKQFSFINEAYSFEIYMAIFALFTATLIVFLIILITRHVNQSVVNAWKENK